MLKLQTRAFPWPQSIDLYEGPPTALRAVTQSFSGASDNIGRVVAGSTYRIAVVGPPGPRPTGPTWADFELDWELRTPAANDNFADAIRLTRPSGSIPASTFAATLQPSEPHPVADLRGSIWYRFDAPVDGTFRFSADRAGAVAYRGENLNALQVLQVGGQFDASPDAGPPCCGRVEIAAERGKTYYFIAGFTDGFFAGSLRGAMTDGTVSWEFTTPDRDGDGVRDDAPDNCLSVPNPDQADADFDGVGDACEPPAVDDDADGVVDELDNCPQRPNASQGDVDGDGIGDACDPDSAADSDGDGVLDHADVCPEVHDPAQQDTDGDGRGDACEPVIEVDYEGAAITSGQPARFRVTLTPPTGVFNPEVTLESGPGLRSPRLYDYGDGWACTDGGGLLRCTFPGLLLGTSAQFVVEYSTQPPFATACTSGSACTFLRAEYPGTGDASREETPVDPFADLRLGLVAAPKQVLALPGSHVDVTATVENAGTTVAQDVHVFLRPFSGALVNGRLIGANNGWTCGPLGGVAETRIECRRPQDPLAPNASAAVTVRFDLSESARFGACLKPTPAPRCVRVESSATALDSAFFDGPTAEIGVAGGSVLGIDIDDAGRAVKQGEPARYDVTVTNTGSTADTGPVAVGLSTCRPNGGDCQGDLLASSVRPVGPNAADWTCKDPSGPLHSIQDQRFACMRVRLRRGRRCEGRSSGAPGRTPGRSPARTDALACTCALQSAKPSETATGPRTSRPHR